MFLNRKLKMFNFIEILFMRKLLFLTALFCGMVASAKTTTPFLIAANPTGINYFLSEPSPKQIKSLKIKDVQKSLGRKLSLKEKIAFFLLKKKMKNADENGSTGNTAFIIAIIGLALFILGLWVPYVLLASLVAAIVAVVMGSMAKRKDPSDRKARAATLMGWINIGLLALLAILVAIIIAAWAWTWG